MLVIGTLASKGKGKLPPAAHHFSGRESLDKNRNVEDPAMLLGILPKGASLGARPYQTEAPAWTVRRGGGCCPEEGARQMLPRRRQTLGLIAYEKV